MLLDCGRGNLGAASAAMIKLWEMGYMASDIIGTMMSDAKRIAIDERLRLDLIKVGRDGPLPPSLNLLAAASFFMLGCHGEAPLLVVARDHTVLISSPFYLGHGFAVLPAIRACGPVECFFLYVANTKHFARPFQKHTQQKEIGATQKRIARGLGTLVQLRGLLARMCGVGLNYAAGASVAH